MRKIYILFFAFALMSATGCKKYLDVNTDPATPQDPDSKSLTPPLFAQMERGIQYDSRFLGAVIQYFGGFVNVGETHGWLQGSDSMGEIWRTNYYGLGGNLNLIIDKSTSNQEWNYVGMAQAMKAWSWQTTTDYHGEIILKQAFEPGRFVFDYDSQADVYAEVVRLANLSIANFSRTDGTGTVGKMATADLVYQGTNAKWIKFNYGVLARNANNLINKANYDPAKVIDYVNKSLESNADNFIVPNTGSSAANGNFYGPLRNNLKDYRQTRMIVSLLDGTALTGNPVPNTTLDPRLPTMISPLADGSYKGTIPGGTVAPDGTAYLLIPNPWGALNSVVPAAGQGKYLFKDAVGFPIMTFAEMQFIKAEAAFRMGNTTMALEAYKNGIGASIDFVSALGTAITSAQKTAYLTSAAVKQTAATITLRDIMLQKYLALYGYGFVETWCDLRKYHYASGDSKGNNPYQGVFFLPTNLYVDNGGLPAQRYRPRYNSEYLWNVAALRKIGGLDNNYHTKLMWFSESTN